MDNAKKPDKKGLEEIVKLKKLIEEQKKQIEEYKTKYLRALADYQNLEKRVNLEKQELIKMANKNLLLKILPIVDDLEKAEIFVKDDGLKLIKDNFLKFLKNEGVEEIEVLGKEFNPQLAEAVEVVKGEKDNIVVEVLRKGYHLGDKILRVAQVKVAKKD
jgi:molecular chaperone GrpE